MGAPVGKGLMIDKTYRISDISGPPGIVCRRSTGRPRAADFNKLFLFMKIGIVTEYFYPTLGGITENVYHISRALLGRGHDVRIITGRRRGCEGVDISVADRIIYLGRSMPVFFNRSCGRVSVGLSLTRRMRDVLDAERFDLIHLHSPLFPTLPPIANAQSTVPVVGTFHTCTGGHPYYVFFQDECSKLLKRMAGRIAVSDCCAREMQRYFDVDFDIMPNGVDVGWWSRKVERIPEFDDGKFNILFLGRPDRRNGLDTLIGAFARVHEKHAEARLIVVGDGPLRFYFERLVPSQIRDSVAFEGSANEARPAYMATGHILCFTPTIASFGVTILEGMSAGKAIVASDIEAFRALVKDGESALLIPPGDEENLAAAIVRLIEDADLRSKLSLAAARSVAPYDWDKVADMQIKYYENVLNGRRSTIQ